MPEQRIPACRTNGLKKATGRIRVDEERNTTLYSGRLMNRVKLVRAKRIMNAVLMPLDQAVTASFAAFDQADDLVLD